MSSLHTQDPTFLSMTDTLTDQKQGEDRRPTFESSFSARTLMNPSPEPPRQPVRKEHGLDSRLTPTTIPPEHPHRTLVLCFDGTGDQFDSDNSNIVQLVSLLKKDDRSKQMVYYQAGIGTYTSPKVATPFMSKVSKTLDTMFAWHLNAHVMGGYEFLMQNYVAGDRICIFGFSRGAYTARSLAGMIHKVGLLPADNFQQVPFAYKMYTRADSVGWEQSNAFKAAFSVDVDIEFLGVWDTVDSVGLIPKRLPFTTSNTIVHTFRHAIALDERRAKFKANLWNRPNAEELMLGTSQIMTDSPVVSPSPLPEENGKETKKSHYKSSHSKESEEELVLRDFEKKYGGKQDNCTDIEEVWFSGCHCDVGGGSVDNKTRYSLARIPLRWMVRECFKTNTGIMFNSSGLRGIGLDPTTLYPLVIPRPPLPQPGPCMVQKLNWSPSWVKRIFSSTRSPYTISGNNDTSSQLDDDENPKTEEEEDLLDALSPIYDQLSLARSWWLLEILPLNLRYQNGDNEWVTYIGSNLARPRFIPKQHSNGVRVHRTVKLRMEANYPCKKHKKYIPKAKLSVEPTWVD